jgi:phage gp36-like protein
VGTEAVSLGALEDATDEVLSYASSRYSAQLLTAVVVPPALKRAVCDIARFRLYKDRPTEQVTFLYENTVKWLVLLANGKVELTFSEPLTEQQTQNLTSTSKPYAASSGGGVFGSDALSAMPTVGSY